MRACRDVIDRILREKPSKALRTCHTFMQHVLRPTRKREVIDRAYNSRTGEVPGRWLACQLQMTNDGWRMTMPHLSRQRRITLTLVATFLAVGFAWYVSSRPMDFRVYYHGAEGVLNESRPVYGNYSGMGWPMHYRYPPVFLFL